MGQLTGRSCKEPAPPPGLREWDAVFLGEVSPVMQLTHPEQKEKYIDSLEATLAVHSFM
jgi:hypothetical protein